MTQEPVSDKPAAPPGVGELLPDAERQELERLRVYLQQKIDKATTALAAATEAKEKAEAELRERDSILAEFNYDVGNRMVRCLGNRARIAIQQEKELQARVAGLERELANQGHVRGGPESWDLAVHEFNDWITDRSAHPDSGPVVMSRELTVYAIACAAEEIFHKHVVQSTLPSPITTPANQP